MGEKKKKKEGIDDKEQKLTYLNIQKNIPSLPTGKTPKPKQKRLYGGPGKEVASAQPYSKENFPIKKG